MPTSVGAARYCEASSNSNGCVELATFRSTDLHRDDLSGVALGPYDLGKKLGQGGMGTLFRALHRQLGKPCAVKFIHPAMATNGQAISRFLQEIQAIGQLNHPHIVCALDAGSCDGVHYYATELLEGQDLQRLVSSSGPMALDKSCSIVRQILDALAHAHERGLVHRDIKPSNIFLTESGHAKLLDFGLARSTQQTSPGLTTTEQLLGTLDYLAPEQAENATQATAESDIYSLGLTWIYLLSGHAPFPDAQYSTMVSKLRGQMVDQPAWLARNARGLPSDVRELLTAMIAKHPQERPKNCREAIVRIDGCLANKTSSTFKLLAVGSALTAVVGLGLPLASLSTTWSTSDQSSKRAMHEQTASELAQATSDTAGDSTSDSDSPAVPPVEVNVPGTHREDGSVADNVQTLSSSKPTANARVIGRPVTKSSGVTAKQLFP
ncbi:MAG: serine/threonine protein kinase [Pirellulaceae bacterium]|nr:serine/threonine protein kinase [Pirellulaceae bacterium]